LIPIKAADRTVADGTVRIHDPGMLAGGAGWGTWTFSLAARNPLIWLGVVVASVEQCEHGGSTVARGQRLKGRLGEHLGWEVGAEDDAPKGERPQGLIAGHMQAGRSFRTVSA